MRERHTQRHVQIQKKNSETVAWRRNYPRTEALCIELLTNRADARFPRLPLLQLLVKLLLQIDDIESCRRCAGHVLHPQLAV